MLHCVCLLGPMVYATCYCPVSRKDIVNELGFAGKLTLGETGELKRVRVH